MISDLCAENAAVSCEGLMNEEIMPIVACTRKEGIRGPWSYVPFLFSQLEEYLRLS